MKKFISLLLALVLCFSVIGCSNSQEASVESNVSEAGGTEKIKLKVMILSEDSNRQAIYQDYYSAKIGKAFPDYEVEFELPGSAENYTSKLTVYNASGTLPDVFWGGDVVYQSGNALPLTKIIEEDGFLSNYSNPAALIPAPDGEIYCLSSGTDSFFAGPIFYNKEIFEKEGLEMPESYEELKTLVTTLKDKGYVPISATGWAVKNFLFADLLSASEDDGLTMARLQSKEISFESEAVLEGARKLQELSALGAFPVDLTSIEQQVHEQLFIDGKAAMIYHPIWVYPAIEAADFEIGFGYLPEVFGNKTVNAWGSATAGGFMVAKNSKHQQAAVEVAEWLSMQDADYWTNVAGNATAIKGFDALPEGAPEVNQYFYDKIRSEESNVLANFPTNYFDSATIAEYETSVEKLVTDQITPEEFVEIMKDLYN
ncbi:extracellular solute-binding protein [Acidaminobacter sp. JC074]|uniref:ABC transporter substrate-binding protein n=1 Tax=Acidaminobacter sp. JC074 TaxID=2530199 RepID=UPI001F1154BD|nr:extracellular solute-binding protein [Acidaminobacter sp. JC074]MCH4887698.1 extracellular solute-binding protein [Acidaminobacter sp. JC074]